MSYDPFIGEVKTFGFGYAPVNFHLCDGALLQISDYNAAYALLGTIYGGDGQATFGVPDLRGRTPIGQGLAPDLTSHTIGERSGTPTNVILSNNLPTGPVVAPIAINNVNLAVTTKFKPKATTDNGDSFDPTDAYWANTVNPDKDYKKEPFTTATTMGEQTTTGTATGALNGAISINLHGQSTPVNNMQPYLVLNYCIALIGLWPSRP